jgi:hypothetical protein
MPTMRASGSRPQLARFSPLMRSATEMPSLVGQELPAVMMISRFP